MSCLTVNTQVNKQVVKIHNQNEIEVKREVPVVPPTEVHYPDLAANEKLSDIVLKIMLKQVANSDKMIELTVDELKEVIKTVCKCDEVLIECDDPLDSVTCCEPRPTNIVTIKKVLLKYNNKAQLEDFKMHYNALKIITEDYRININEVTRNEVPFKAQTALRA